MLLSQVDAESTTNQTQWVDLLFTYCVRHMTSVNPWKLVKTLFKENIENVFRRNSRWFSGFPDLKLVRIISATLTTTFRTINNNNSIEVCKCNLLGNARIVYNIQQNCRTQQAAAAFLTWLPHKQENSENGEWCGHRPENSPPQKHEKHTRTHCAGYSRD